MWNVGTLGMMMDMSPNGRAGAFLGFWTLVVTLSRGLGVSSGGPVRDIVLAMTNGQFGTQVLANLMYDQGFRAFHDGRASTVALVIMIAVVPILVWNLRQYAKEESNR
ncbi:MAG: hypothetical protein HC828_15745 [Blastochloris sp.]|nr:hypothetical protein [Blastochloris sp.]